MLIGSRKCLLPLLCGVAVICGMFLIHDVRKTVNVTSINQWLRSHGVEAYGPETVYRSSNNGGPAMAVPVVIATYMRSGSSVVGDIVQQAHGAFYVYEPMRLYERAFYSNKTADRILTRNNGSRRYPPYDYTGVQLGVLRSWFSCNLMSLYHNSLQDGFLKKGRKTTNFQICYKEMLTTTKNKTNALATCINRLQKLCLDSPVRVIKTIRMSMEAVKSLISEFPNLKIIHLVRDPRATLASQKKLGMCGSKRGGQPGCTSSYCKRLENDVLESEVLHQTHPHNIMTLFYEDLAYRPLETSKTLYEFVGTTFTPRVEEYVYNITMAGNPNDCVICTTRSNSSEHVEEWKRKTPRAFIDVIQERCNYILRKFKYELV